MRLFVLILIFMLNCTISNGQNDCTTTDSLELLRLFNENQGDNWSYTKHKYQNFTLYFDSIPTPNAGSVWTTQKPYSTWHGVKVNEQGCVTGLYLERVNLSGPMLDLQFPFLEEISFRRNNLDNGLPDFSGIPNLRKIDITGNESIGGEIPNFKNLIKLEYIMALNCNLTGNLPSFDALKNITTISLGNNKLYEEIPNYSLNTLEIFSVSVNSLSGRIPNFEECPNLKWIYLDNNMLEGRLPTFDKTSLTNLTVNDNNLSGHIPNYFDYHPDFNLIRVHDNHFTFEDIIPIHSIFLEPDTYIPKDFHKPQKDVVIPDTLYGVLGEQFIYTFEYDDGLDGNVFVWFKDDDFYKIVEYHNDFIIDTLSFDDQGVYFTEYINIDLFGMSLKCNDTYLKVLEPISFANDLEKDCFKSLTVFPNPVLDDLNISNPCQLTFNAKIIDVMGKVHQELKLDELNSSINMSHLANGTYYMYCYFDDQRGGYTIPFYKVD